MDGATTQKLENNRARVRRIVFGPMGFRFKKGTPTDEQAKYFADVADLVAYMADERLVVLREFMATHGEGRLRDQWSPLPVWRIWAERAQPRPLEELPCLVSWFASVEGPRAIANRTLVETWDYLEKHKVPPASEGAKRRVLDDARTNASLLERIEERIRLDLPTAPEDLEQAQKYRKKEARVAALVHYLRAKQAGPSDGKAAHG